MPNKLLIGSILPTVRTSFLTAITIWIALMATTEPLLRCLNACSGFVNFKQTLGKAPSVASILCNNNFGFFLFY